MATTHPTSFRLSPESRARLGRLRARYSTAAARPSAADVIELALLRLEESDATSSRDRTSGKSKKS